MPVRFNVNQQHLQNKVENPLTKEGIAMLSSQILKDCNFFCKEDTEGKIGRAHV